MIRDRDAARPRIFLSVVQYRLSFRTFMVAGIVDMQRLSKELVGLRLTALSRELRSDG
jgi:hypothetical protein